MKATVFSLLIMFSLMTPVLAICEEVNTMGKNEPNSSENQKVMKISMKANGNTIVFKLNDSPANFSSGSTQLADEPSVC